MEAIGSSAAIVSSSSTSSSFLSPVRRGSSSRLLFRTSSAKNGNDSNQQPDSNNLSIVPSSFVKKSTLSSEFAMGLVLSAASVRGWTTGSGLEGPSIPVGDSSVPNVSTFPWSLFTKSPRRRMRVSFTCNVCGQRTTRAINPHAYNEGTVFVQCCGCNVFHKLVDNLNLFYEMKCYVNPSFNYASNAQVDPEIGFNLYDFGVTGEEKDADDVFPV